MAAASNIVEVSALLGLSSISSVENFELHEVCFLLFTGSAFICMISICLLNTIIHTEAKNAKKSAYRKKISLFFYTLSLLLSLYAYYRHNKYCEPGVYTLFALFEYTAIISNIMFHHTSTMDFDGYSLCVIDPADRLR